MAEIATALAISAAVSAASAGITYALTPTQKIESGKIQDLTTAKTNYGAAIPWIWGGARVAGNLIWSTFLEEDKQTRRQGKGAKVKTSQYTYYGSFALLFVECPFRPLVDFRRIWMNKKLVFSQVGGAETIAEGGKFAQQYMRTYPGNKDQDLDPLLQNVQPIQNFNFGLPADFTQRADFLRSQGIDPISSAFTPSYNQRGVIVFQRLPLGDFYNSLPTVEAEVIGSQNCTAGQIVGDIMGLLYEAASFDVSLISTTEFNCAGFFVNSVEAAKSAIQNLQKAYFFDVLNRNGVITFVPQNSPRDIVYLSPKDLAAAPDSEGKASFDYEIIESDPTSLPSQVIVSYIDHDLNYDTNEQRSQGEYLQDRNPNPVTISLPIVMSADQAAQIADRAFFLLFNQTKIYKFKLPPAYLDLEVGDLISGLFEDAPLLKATQNRIGANLILEIEAELFDLSFWQYKRSLKSGKITTEIAVYNQNIPVEGSVTAVSRISDGYVYVNNIDYVVNPDGSVTILSGGGIPVGTTLGISTVSYPSQTSLGQGEIIPYTDTQLLVLDIPLIEDQDEDYTLYLAAAGTGRWNGCAVYISVDDLRYFLLGTITTPSVIGTCQSQISPTGTYTSTITVATIDNELESISTNDLALGLNTCLFGNQIRKFKTAEIPAPETWQLSDVYAPQRGTQGQLPPQVGDRFVLLKGENAFLKKIKYKPEDMGQVRYFKAVSSGQTLDEVAPVIITLQGNAQKPYPPRFTSYTYDTPGNITLQWGRFDRHDPSSALINFDTIADQEYELNILDSSQNIVRSYTAIHNVELVYPVADQITDFGSAQTSLWAQVAEVNAEFGRGDWTTKNLTLELRNPSPNITDFSPKSAAIGATITLTGSAFTFVEEAFVDNQPQSNLVVIDDNHLTFVLGNSAVSGLLRLAGTSGQDVFRDYPLIVV